jgi:hypothetical protein
MFGNVTVNLSKLYWLPPNSKRTNNLSPIPPIKSPKITYKFSTFIYLMEKNSEQHEAKHERCEERSKLSSF